MFAVQGVRLTRPSLTSARDSSTNVDSSSSGSLNLTPQMISRLEKHTQPPGDASDDSPDSSSGDSERDPEEASTDGEEEEVRSPTKQRPRGLPQRRRPPPPRPSRVLVLLEPPKRRPRGRGNSSLTTPWRCSLTPPRGSPPPSSARPPSQEPSQSGPPGPAATARSRGTQRDPRTRPEDSGSRARARVLPLRGPSERRQSLGWRCPAPRSDSEEAPSAGHLHARPRVLGARRPSHAGASIRARLRSPGTGRKGQPSHASQVLSPC